MDPILQTTNLTKTYTNNKGAFNINITLNKGEIVGFLGPNGAGKTTTIRTILGFANLTGGSYKLFGEQITTLEDLQKVIEQIGFLPGEPTFPTSLTVKEILNYSASLSQNFDKQYFDHLIQSFEIDLNKKFGRLSLGNKKKVAIVNALQHKPKLLILDEPTNSLDPIMQNKVLKELTELKKTGSTIFFSSHVLSEVEKITDRIILIKDGKILMEGDTKKVLNGDSKKIRIEFGKESKKLRNIFKKGITQNDNGDYIILTSDVKKDVTTLFENDITDFYIEHPTLEDIFMKYYE